MLVFLDEPLNEHRSFGLQVRVWDWKKHAVTNCFAATGGPREASGTPTLHAPVTELAFINLCESNLLLVGGADGCVRIWHNYAQRCVTQEAFISTRPTVLGTT